MNITDTNTTDMNITCNNTTDMNKTDTNTTDMNITDTNTTDMKATDILYVPACLAVEMRTLKKNARDTRHILYIKNSTTCAEIRDK